MLAVDSTGLDLYSASTASSHRRPLQPLPSYYQPIQLPPSPTPSPSSSPFLTQSAILSPTFQPSPKIHVTHPSMSSTYESLLHHPAGGPGLRASHPPSYQSLKISTKSDARKMARIEWMKSGGAWIALYFAFNMGLTLYNKTILVHFPFPYSLTAIHTFCGTVGCWYLKSTGYFVSPPCPPNISTRANPLDRSPLG